MRFSRRGIAPAVLAVVAIVIVAIAGTGAYLALSSKPASTTSTTSTTSSSTPPSTSSTSVASSSTTSSSSSSTSSSAAAVTTTCSTSSTSVSTTSSFNVVPLVSAYKAMELKYNLTSGSNVENLTESYTRIYASATTYKVNVTGVTSGQTESETAWILKNGTVLAVGVAGENLTGSTAQEMIIGVFAGFAAEVETAGQLNTYTANQYFHTTGTSSVTISGNTFKVTNWAANKLPETIQTCTTGTTDNVTSYNLSTGTPTGASSPLVTYFEFAGSSSASGTATNFDYVIHVVSFTVG